MRSPSRRIGEAPRRGPSGLRRARFSDQRRERRHIVVALEQGGRGPGTSDDALVQAPDCLVDRAAVAVDQQRRTAASSSRAKPARWISPTASSGKAFRYAAASRPWFVHDTCTLVTSSSSPQPVPAQHLANEARLVHRRAIELDVGRRVLQQHAQTEALLHAVNVAAHASERGLVIGDRQQVVEEHAPMRRPGQVFGERCRLVALDQPGQPIEVRLVGGTSPPSDSPTPWSEIG